MSTQYSMLSIFNAALLSQGFEEIVAENDGTDEWRLLSRNWPTIVEAELEDSNYSFTRKEETLLTRSPGAFGFDDAYLVPEAALHVRHLWLPEPRVETDWMQDGQRVHLNSPNGVVIEYVEAADASFWGANFTRGVQMKLEAVLLRFKEEPAQAREMEGQAEIYFQRARTKSSKARSAGEPFKKSRFAKARFTRG